MSLRNAWFEVSAEDRVCSAALRNLREREPRSKQSAIPAGDDAVADGKPQVERIE
jgi:hypothetical protein